MWLENTPFFDSRAVYDLKIPHITTLELDMTLNTPYYNSRVIIYDRRAFIRLTTGAIWRSLIFTQASLTIARYPTAARPPAPPPTTAPTGKASLIEDGQTQFEVTRGRAEDAAVPATARRLEREKFSERITKCARHPLQCKFTFNWSVQVRVMPIQTENTHLLCKG